MPSGPYHTSEATAASSSSECLHERFSPFHDFIALDIVPFLRVLGTLLFWQHLEHKLWFCLENICEREIEENIESPVKSIRYMYGS